MQTTKKYFTEFVETFAAQITHVIKTVIISLLSIIIKLPHYHC